MSPPTLVQTHKPCGKDFAEAKPFELLAATDILILQATPGTVCSFEDLHATYLKE